MNAKRIRFNDDKTFSLGTVFYFLVSVRYKDFQIDAT